MKRTVIGLAWSWRLAARRRRPRPRRRGGRPLQHGPAAQAAGQDPRGHPGDGEGHLAALGLRRRPLHPGQPVARSRATYAKAAAALEKAVELQPKDAGARANLGAVYLRQKRIDDGIAHAGDGPGAEARRLRDPGLAGLRLPAEGGPAQGGRPPAEGHHAEARRRRRLEQPGRGQVAHRRQGGGHRRVQEGPGAGARTTPTTTSAWRPCTAASARPSEAIASYQAALEHNPKLAGAYYDLGVLLLPGQAARKRPWPPSATTSSTASTQRPQVPQGRRGPGQDARERRRGKKTASSQRRRSGGLQSA